MRKVKEERNESDLNKELRLDRPKETNRGLSQRKTRCQQFTDLENHGILTKKASAKAIKFLLFIFKRLLSLMLPNRISCNKASPCRWSEKKAIAKRQLEQKTVEQELG